MAGAPLWTPTEFVSNSDPGHDLGEKEGEKGSGAVKTIPLYRRAESCSVGSWGPQTWPRPWRWQWCGPTTSQTSLPPSSDQWHRLNPQARPCTSSVLHQRTLSWLSSQQGHVLSGGQPHPPLGILSSSICRSRDRTAAQCWSPWLHSPGTMGPKSWGQSPGSKGPTRFPLHRPSEESSTLCPAP